MDFSNRSDAIVKCQTDIADSLRKTLAQLSPAIEKKYNIDSEDVGGAIAWAATSVAIENHMQGTGFDEEQLHELHIHINYLFHGAKTLARDLADEDDDFDDNEPPRTR